MRGALLKSVKKSTEKTNSLNIYIYISVQNADYFTSFICHIYIYSDLLCIYTMERSKRNDLHVGVSNTKDVNDIKLLLLRNSPLSHTQTK